MVVGHAEQPAGSSDAWPRPLRVRQDPTTVFVEGGVLEPQHKCFCDELVSGRGTDLWAIANAGAVHQLRQRSSDLAWQLNAMIMTCLLVATCSIWHCDALATVTSQALKRL